MRVVTVVATLALAMPAGAQDPLYETRPAVPILVARSKPSPPPARAKEQHTFTTLYISPTGAGERDGSSWENAGTIRDISNFVSAAGPGGRVLLLADQGVYKSTGQITIQAGGGEAAPVTIQGVDSAGRSMAAVIVGTRAEQWAPGAEQGSEVFRLVNGADHLRFEDLSFKNIGNGAFRIGGQIQDLTIERIRATNVRRFIENNAAGDSINASITGLVVRDVQVNGYSKGAIRLQYDSNNVLVENVTGDSQRQNGDNFAMGVLLHGTVHDVVLRNVTMKNNYDTYAHRGGRPEGNDYYWNGDGFTTEGGAYNIRFEHTKSLGNTDAGYDLKSKNTELVGVAAEDNKINYRIWSPGTLLKDSVSANTTKRGGTGTESHVWVAKGAGVVVINSKLSDQSPDALFFDLDDGAHVFLQHTTISKLESAKRSQLGQGAELLEGSPSSPRSPTGVGK